MPILEIAGIKVAYDNIAEVPSAIQKEISERNTRLAKLDRERTKVRAEIRKLKTAIGGKAKTASAGAQKPAMAAA